MIGNNPPKLVLLLRERFSAARVERMATEDDSIVWLLPFTVSPPFRLPCCFVAIAGVCPALGDGWMRETTNDSRRAGPVLQDWVSREDLACDLGVTVDTLRRWALRRTGPSFTKAGRRVLYSRQAINDWLQSLEVKTYGGRNK